MPGCVPAVFRLRFLYGRFTDDGELVFDHCGGGFVGCGGVSVTDGGPFENVLGVGQASTLNVDGGFEAWRRFPCGFSAPGTPWEPMYDEAGHFHGYGDPGNGRSPYVASEQVLSWAQKEGWWR